MKALLTALLIIINCACLAQKNDDSLYFEKLGTTVFKLDFKKASAPATIPFSQIQIIDARADTSCVGFFKYSLSENTKKIVFPNGLNNEIADYVLINYQLTNDSLNKLLLFIKEFRISNYVKHLDENFQTEKDKIIPTNPWKSGVVISAELFLQNKNTFHALYKIDTVLVNDSAVLLHNIIQKSFAVLFSKISDKKLSEIHIGKTEFSSADIHQHIESFFNFPILKDSILKKGIYKNFSEFKLNNPSIVNYEINRGKLSDEIYIREDSQLYPLRSFWGFCDGKNLFIRSADNIFPMIRANNTFNVRGTKALTINNHALENTLVNGLTTGIFGVYPEQSNNSSYIVRRTALQLNMQNGELY